MYQVTPEQAVVLESETQAQSRNKTWVSPPSWPSHDAFKAVIIEVKCPFCIKNGSPKEDTNGGFCMTKKDGKWSLKRNHTQYL